MDTVKLLEKSMLDITDAKCSCSRNESINTLRSSDLCCGALGPHTHTHQHQAETCRQQEDRFSISCSPNEIDEVPLWALLPSAAYCTFSSMWLGFSPSPFTAALACQPQSKCEHVLTLAVPHVQFDSDTPTNLLVSSKIFRKVPLEVPWRA